MKKVVLFIPIAILLIIAIILSVYIIIGHDNEIKIATETVESYKIKDEIKLLAISDLHCTSYGEKQSILLDKISQCNPDVLLLLGDIFDSSDDPTPSIDFLEQIAEIYPVYAIKGNHEIKTKDHVENYIDEVYDECGIPQLKNEYRVLKFNNTTVNLCGVDSRYFDSSNFTSELLNSLIGVDTSNFTIMMNHRPDTVYTCVNHNVDLMLSGHAHGGQWALPGVFCGLYAPNQGFFPDYVGGKYLFSDGMTLIVSRGLAINTIIPRVFNPPEINLITLKPENK